MRGPAHSLASARDTQAGLTLIELMVAMGLGLIVTVGVVAIFQSTSSSNRAQTQLARLQEEGRFAVTRMKRDLEKANGLYCNNSGGAARPAEASQLYLDGLRAPVVYSKYFQVDIFDVTTYFGTTSGSNTYPAEPTAPYSMPSYLFMRGYDCGLTAASCKPVDPGAYSWGPSRIPNMGKAVNSRVIGTDVITVRYLDPDRGWAIGGSGTSIATVPSTGAIDSITLRPLPGEPPVTDYANGTVMLADCSGAQVFHMGRSGSQLWFTGYTFARPVLPRSMSAPKLFNFGSSFHAVTYYVKVVDNGNGQTTGALVRRVDGGPKYMGWGGWRGTEEELVRGVERLDFRYGIQDAHGKVRYVTADVVDAGKGIPCPPGEPNPITTVGCLWRAVSSIEVNLVVSGQNPLYTLAPGELAYTYGIDGKTTPTAPSKHKIKPSDQGFPEPMLRREFTAVVAVRNFNP